ncbi:MAG: DJ-1/PfpI family protein [Rhodospirillales bacterium]|nr:DJ-1/PfpI family protein [Alphaproteobacteria bacterium]USO03500.1 MAG: DJ-1/PfpI family protein [Rhodospirillales bacterium]
MVKSMTGFKIAVLAANGFDEKDLTLAQRALVDAGASVKIVSTDQGLVNGWDGRGWGHNYAVDAQINTALGVDYDALVLPGGQRSLDKLKLTAHTKRFIGSFMAAMKPVAVMGEALQLMADAAHLADRKVAGPDFCRARVEEAGGTWSGEDVCIDHALISGACDAETKEAFVQAMAAHFERHMALSEAA